MNILTTSGYKNISEVNIGDKVIGTNGVENILIEKEYLDYNYYKRTKSKREYKFFLINGNKKLFKNQSICSNGNVTHVYLLKVGDIIYDESGVEIVIHSIVKINWDNNSGWWKLSISGDHSFISENILLHNASRFLVAGGTGNWNSTTNWSATTGGASGASFPVAGDAVTFDANSLNANMTVNVASACASLVMSAYTGTFTMTSTLTLSSTLTLVAGMTYAGAGNLTVLAGTTATWTSGGVTVTGGISVNSGAVSTITLSGTWLINGSLTILNNAFVLNGAISVGGTFTMANNVSGTSAVTMVGTGTLSTTGSGVLSKNITINTAGTITISGILSKSGGTFTYTAGTVVTTGSTLLVSSTAILNVNGIIWNDISFAGTQTKTLSSDMAYTGSLTFTNVTHTINGSTISGVDVIAGTSTLTGSTNFIFTAGTVSGTAWTLNKTGTVTFAGTITWTLVTFTRTAGTVVATGSTLIMSGSRTFAGATTWNNWDITAVATITLNALQTLAGTLTLRDNITFAGSSSWTVNTLDASVVPSKTYTLTSTRTYTITNSFLASGASPSHSLFKSSIGGSQAILTLNVGATQSVSFVDATDIDSSAGQTIFSFQGVLVNTLNWNSTGGTVAYAVVGG